MLQTQPFEINDFSGGITDFYVNGPPNQGQRMDNLIILNNKSMVMRAGSEVDDTANDLLPAGNVKINEIINFNNSTHLMVNSAKKIYFRNPSA